MRSEHFIKGFLNVRLYGPANERKMEISSYDSNNQLKWLQESETDSTHLCKNSELYIYQPSIMMAN